MHNVVAPHLRAAFLCPRARGTPSVGQAIDTVAYFGGGAGNISQACSCSENYLGLLRVVGTDV